MPGKSAISLTTGLEDPEKVTVAYVVAVGAAESGRPTMMFLTKEAVRLALEGTAVGVACEGCPPLPDLLKRYADAGGRYYVSRPSATVNSRPVTRAWPQKLAGIAQGEPEFHNYEGRLRDRMRARGRL